MGPLHWACERTFVCKVLVVEPQQISGECELHVRHHSREVAKVIKVGFLEEVTSEEAPVMNWHCLGKGGWEGAEGTALV